MPGWAGRKLVFQECVESTNEEAKRGGDAGAEHGTVYQAKVQTAGKGRRGRTWVSDSEENLYFTILLKPDFAPEKATMLTLVMADAVAEAIEKNSSLPTGIKWPNDIVVNGRKVCGILSEMKLVGSQIAYCVIGVGINIGQAQFPEELKDTATSLMVETGKDIEMEALLKDILANFEQAYERFCSAGDLTFLLERYNNLLVNKGKVVRVLEPGGAYEGISEGISAKGELLVRTEDGTVQKVYAGEVSVRGLYGYV